MKAARSTVRLTACALLALGSTSALAQSAGPLRYDFVSVNAALPELDEIGIELVGQTLVTERILITGAYQDWDWRDGVERKTLEIGGGYRLSIRPSIDVLASAHYADHEIDARGGRSVDEEGLILSGLIRGWLTPRIELSGELMLDNSTGSSTETVVAFGGQFMRRANLSYGGRLRVDEEDTALFFGARFYFGASRR